MSGQDAVTAPIRYDKIGGWLILVAIGLVLTPLRLSIAVFRDLLPVFWGDAWGVLTTPGTEAYHPLWAPLLIFETAGNCIFALFSIVILIFFFQRRQLTPVLIITFYLANLLFISIDHFGAGSIPLVAKQQDTESMRELARALIACVIWVPYFRISKRVKGTFVT